MTDEESAVLFETGVRPRMPGISPAIVRTATCIYTFTPDADFLVDRAGGDPNVLVVSACSGHGFKHSAALGEAIAQRVTGRSDGMDLGVFSAERYRAVAGAA